MKDARRRPPFLLDAALDRGSLAARDGNGPRNVELRRCLGSLRSEVDAVLRRHEEELCRYTERWPAPAVASDAGWQSAPSDPRPRVLGLPFPGGAGPATPKLPPPPAPLTPLCSNVVPPKASLVSGVGQGRTDNRRVQPAPSAADGAPLAGAGSPRSSLSTRTGSRSVSQASIPEGLWVEEFRRDSAIDMIDQDEARSGRSSNLSPLDPELVSRAGPQPPACSSPTRPLNSPPLMQAEISGASATSCGLRATASKGPAALEPLSLEAPFDRLPTHLTIFTSEDSDASSIRRKKNSMITKSLSKSLVYSPISKRKTDLLITNRSYFSRLTRSHGYEVLTTVAIFLNALFILVQTESRATMAGARASAEDMHLHAVYFGVAANVFCLIFVVDLVLRLVAERWHFFLSRERDWNLFDVFMSTTAVLESVVSYGYPTQASKTQLFLRKFSMLRILRLLRVVRVTRAVRVIRFIKELRLMVFSLTGSLKSLAWAVVLIFIILLVFGVCIMDGVVAYCVQHNDMHSESTSEMRKYFGSLSAAVMSLFMAMSGGVDWADILVSLEPLPIEYTVLFVGFIVFSILALLNVVTAVFVNTAMQRSQNDRELVVSQEMEGKSELINIIQQVFVELDKDGNGCLRLEEFEAHIEDETIMAYLRSREIDIGQVRTLFALLDVDRTGDVDMDEFVQGIIRLKGAATSMDLAVLTYKVEWILHNVMALQQLCRKSLGEGEGEADEPPSLLHLRPHLFAARARGQDGSSLA